MAHDTAYSRSIHMRRLITSCLAVCPSFPLILFWEGLKPKYLTQLFSIPTKRLLICSLHIYELARQNLGERADAQAATNVSIRFKQFQPDHLVLVHQPHHADDDANNKL